MSRDYRKKRNLHFFLPEDQALFDYDYIFSASAMWVELGMSDVTATFDLFVRDLPRQRNFLLFTGLEEMISGILSWKFTEDDIAFLLERKIITPKLGPYLRDFKFDGNIWAMPEGTIFFPGEPVLRIRGKLWQINLFTFFLMNSLTSNTVFSSKLARCILAADNKLYVATCSPVRGHAHEAALKFGRAAYLFGSASGMVPGFAKKFSIPFISRARGFHAFIKSFPSEIDAFRSVAKIFPDSSVMIDTYDLKIGIQNVIKVCLDQKRKDLPVFSAVFIDSGSDVKDFADQAKFVRSELDRVGLNEVQITVAGNFQEYKIKELIKLKAPVNKVILGTEGIVPADDPKIEAVLKMAQFIQNNKVVQTAKLAKGKVSFPGVKQVYRKFNKQGLMVSDTIGLEDENGAGEPLLVLYVKNGSLTRNLPELDELKEVVQMQLKSLPSKLREINKVYHYPVKISRTLNKLLLEVRNKHVKRLEN